MQPCTWKFHFNQTQSQLLLREYSSIAKHRKLPELPTKHHPEVQTPHLPKLVQPLLAVNSVAKTPTLDATSPKK